MTRYSSFLSECLDTVVPQYCVLCGAKVGAVPWSPAPLCSSCERTLEYAGEPHCGRCGRRLISELDYCVECREEGGILFHIVPLFEFRGRAASLIHSYKTQERVSLVHYFAYKIAQRRGEIFNFAPTQNNFSLVPVPPRPEKLHAGKIDQVGVLAESLGRFGLHCEKPLKRLPIGNQQKLLDRAGRLKNAMASYALKSSTQVPGEAVLLDDVCTTGATLEACAKLLSQAGAHVIGAVVLAVD